MPNEKDEGFVRHILQVCARSKGDAAHLRRADSDQETDKPWQILATFNLDLTNREAILPYITVMSAIARSEARYSGTLNIGAALAKSFKDAAKNEQAQARLRRLLACDSLLDLTQVLRPMLALINSRGVRGLDYVQMLRDLKGFRYDDSRSRTKARWAGGFFGIVEDVA